MATGGSLNLFMCVFTKETIMWASARSAPSRVDRLADGWWWQPLFIAARPSSVTTRVQWRGNKTWVWGRWGSERPFTVTSVSEALFQEGTVHLHPRTVFGNSRPHSKHGSSARRCSGVWGAITGELHAKAVRHRWTVAWGKGDCSNSQLHVRKYLNHFGCVFFMFFF